MWISAALAQAYTEGGAGKQGIYTQTNNCFGIMAGPKWNGRVYKTKDGRCFRSYRTMEESVLDYILLIQNQYTGALQTTSPEDYLNYLLSRNYGESWMLKQWCSIIYAFNLKQYD